jgi:DNA-binding MurR/RpiR family transcriptional regulator
MTLDDINASIDARFEDFPKLLRVAAKYVRENPERVALHSLRQVSELAKVHPSSLMRLVRELGFPRYNEFRDPFRHWLSARRTPMRSRVQGLRDKGKMGRVSETVDELRAADLADLQSAATQIKVEDLVKAARIIVGARRVFIVGLRSLYSAAYLLDYSCKMFSTNTVLIDGRGGALGDEIRHAGPKDAVVVLSHRHYSKDAVRIARFAQRAGAKIISIVDSPLAPTVKISNVNLVLTAHTSSVLSSMVSTMSVVQCLVAVLVVEIGDGVFEELKHNETYFRAFDTFTDY